MGLVLAALLAAGPAPAQSPRAHLLQAIGDLRATTTLLHMPEGNPAIATDERPVQAYVQNALSDCERRAPGAVVGSYLAPHGVALTHGRLLEMHRLLTDARRELSLAGSGDAAHQVDLALGSLGRVMVDAHMETYNPVPNLDPNRPPAEVAPADPDPGTHGQL